MIVAIDGPSGAGKSTLGKMLAKKLRLLYLDTGAMYRAAALSALQSGVSLEDQEKVADIAQRARIELVGEPDDLTVMLDGNDVSTAIRTLEVAQGVSRRRAGRSSLQVRCTGAQVSLVTSEEKDAISARRHFSRERAADSPGGAKNDDAPHVTIQTDARTERSGSAGQGRIAAGRPGTRRGAAPSRESARAGSVHPLRDSSVRPR